MHTSGFFNQIYFHGTNTKIASSNDAEIMGSGYPQHFHIILAWGAKVFSPHFDSTQSLYMFVLANLVFLALVGAAIFFAIASISGDKLFVFAPAMSLIVGVLFYSSATSSYLEGWYTFLFSQLIACLAVFVIYKILKDNFHGHYGILCIGTILCLLTNIWYLMGLVVLILYAAFSLISGLTLRKFALLVVISLPALLTPLYFLYPRVGLSALTSGGSPGYSWRLFLIASAVAFLFCISPKELASSKYSIYVLSILFATWLCVFTLFLLVQVDSEGVTYYLGKLIQGSFVIVISGLAIILVSKLDLADIRTNLNLSGIPSTLLFSSVLSFALLNSLVYIGPSFRDSTDRLHLNTNNSNIRILLGPSQEAIRLLNISNYVKNDVNQTLYISTFNTEPNNRLADLWVRVLAGNWTYQSEESSMILNSVSRSNPTSVFEATKIFLSKYPEGRIVMSLDFYNSNQEQFDAFRDSNFLLIDDFGKNSNIP